jgi:hypothetical protein
VVGLDKEPGLTMSGDVTRDEFSRLATRTGILERRVQGLRAMRLQILDLVRREGDDLAAIKTRLGRIEDRLDACDESLVNVDSTGLGSTVDGLSRKLDDLRRNLPHVVRKAVREAMKPSRRKP